MRTGDRLAIHGLDRSPGPLAAFRLPQRESFCSVTSQNLVALRS